MILYMDIKNVQEIILKNSNSKNITEAFEEWKVNANIKKPKYCSCGKSHVIDTYELKNITNDKILQIRVFD